LHRNQPNTHLQPTLPKEKFDTSHEERNNWFSSLVASIRTDKLMLETNTADESKVNLYNSLISGDPTSILSKIRDQAKQHFVTNALIDYFIEIKVRTGNNHVGIKTLATSYSDSEVLIWAVIEDDNEEVWDQIIFAAATVNLKYYEHGYLIKTMVVEESDNLSIPNHYQVIWP